MEFIDNNKTDLFCTIINQRSQEHSRAIRLMIDNCIYGQVISILRQELDSMVRVIYLLSIDDLSLRQHFISQTLEGKKWIYPNTNRVVTDRQMVDLSKKLHGWTSSVYKLGCAFIHLSAMNYYNNTNPFSVLPDNEIEDIKKHLNCSHGFPMEKELCMESVIPYFSMVFDKVQSNLGFYVNTLTERKILSL